jgi:5,10-methylene-tetrahydrofolate dehydrogenase/methenyl tetrahydrofolate cyclohydrolase
VIRRYGDSGAIIMDGRLLADDILHIVRDRIKHLNAIKHVTPGLAVILVGDNHPDSQRYVRRKKVALTPRSSHHLLDGAMVWYGPIGSR